MENGLADIGFYNSWIWLVFVGLGLVLITLELLVGVETGLDMVFIGSAFILGGLVTVAMHSWAWTLVATVVICILYLFIGRRYIHRNIGVRATRTNIDAIIGKTGIVQKETDTSGEGTVKVGTEQWRARSAIPIKEGEEIIVTGIHGITLDVKKAEGGNV